MYNSTVESLKKVSDIFLTTAESSTSSKDNSWEDPAKNAPQQPVLVQQVQTPPTLTIISQFAKHNTSNSPWTRYFNIPRDHPTRAGTYWSSSTKMSIKRGSSTGKHQYHRKQWLFCKTNTRSRCVSVVALTLLSASQARRLQWKPKNIYNDASPIGSLAELASAVLEGEGVLTYRLLINYPPLGQAWRKPSFNEFGRLAQGVGERTQRTDAICVCQQGRYT